MTTTTPPPTPPPFIPGWTPELAARGADRFRAAGRRLFAGAKFSGDDRPLPDGFSLSGLLKWPYDQGPVGSCFANMGAHILQLMMLGTEADRAFNPSRRLIWHRARQLDGTLGSAEDGGSIVHSFAALGDAPDGVGDCPEDLCDYRPDHDYLERDPGPEAVRVAGSTRVATIAEAPFDRDAWRRSILNVSPIGMGIYWPESWGPEGVDVYGRTRGVGPGGFGHAVAAIGWLLDWDGHAWFEVLNSWGRVYPGLPAPAAARVLGYAPTRHSFWAREDHLAEVVAMPWTELYHAAGVGGFAPVPTPDAILSIGEVV